MDRKFLYYGYDIKRSKKVEKDLEKRKSFAPPSETDGSITIDASVSAGGIYAHYLELDSRSNSEIQLIKKYRDIVNIPEVDMATDHIINEAISFDDEDPVYLNLDDLQVEEKVKKEIIKEFEYIIKLLNFNTKGYEIFRSWYIDSKLYYHKIIDTKQPSKGIRELRKIDPITMKKVKEIEKVPSENGVQELVTKDEYYLYIPDDKMQHMQAAVKISPDAITYVPSGMYDNLKRVTLGYLYKAIKPSNQLKMMEDAIVIYRISRAPERRVFYIDVGNLPKNKAEQYVRNMMQQYRNKMVYDATTGEMRDDRRHLSMMEDYWMPRREGGRGTEITTLDGGQNLGEIQDVEYFKRKLYKALNIPVSRLESDANFSLGRASEITRDELLFSKFVARLRIKFSELFLDILKTQLILKNIFTPEEWDKHRVNIYVMYAKDSHFTELKDSEILQGRVEVLSRMENYIGKFFSNEWIKKNVLYQTDEEISEINKQIDAEKKSGDIPKEDEEGGYGGGRRY